MLVIFRKKEKKGAYCDIQSEDKLNELHHQNKAVPHIMRCFLFFTVFARGISGNVFQNTLI